MGNKTNYRYGIWYEFVQLLLHTSGSFFLGYAIGSILNYIL